jgi:hypothetical protein
MARFTYRIIGKAVKFYGSNSMDKTIRKFTGVAAFEEVKADDYRYWQSRRVHERVAAVSELTQEQYEMKGEVQGVPRLQGTLVRFERHEG